MRQHADPVSTATATFPRPLGLRFREAAREQLLLAERHLSGEGGDPHKDIHEARKCIRRTRAMLALGMRELDPRTGRLDDELARLCRGLSRLRDAHALIEAVHRLTPERGHDGGLIQLADEAARARRDDMLSREIARDPGFLRRRHRLFALSERLARLDWEALDAPRVEAAVARSERRVRKARKRASRRAGGDHDWHAFRRRVRRLRQQDTVLAALCPDLRPAAGDIDEQAAALGEAQDDALVLRHCGRGSPFGTEDRALLRALANKRLALVRRRWEKGKGEPRRASVRHGTREPG